MRSELLVAAAALSALSCKTGERQKTFEIRRDSAVTYYDTGDLNRAAYQALLALELEPNDPMCLAIFGMTKARESNMGVGRPADMRGLNEAINAFEKAEENGGKKIFQVEFGHGLARAARAQSRLVRAAAADSRIASVGGSATQPASPEAAEAIESLKTEATRLRTEAEPDLAVAEDRLRAAYRIQPNSLDCLDQLQALYSLRNQPEASVDWGRKSLALNDIARADSKRVLERAGRNAPNEDEARRQIRRFDLRETNVRSLLALMLYRMGQAQEAAAELDRVLQLDPDRVDEYNNRGICRQAIGDYSGAIADYELFLRRSSLNPDSKEIREVWDRLAECRRKATKAPVSVR